MKVTDDGIGISEERLQALQFTESSAQHSVGYGLRNVHDRIQLYFGEEYGIRIKSELGRGTEVSLWLPFCSEEG
jgi:two-component system sensor histidine kinase YesM